MKKSNVMRILSAALVFVMVFGLFTFFAPEGIVLSASALSYDGSGSTSFGNSEEIRIINHTRADKGKGKSDAIYAFDGMTWKAADEDNYIVWEGTDENTFYGVYPVADYAEYDSFTIPTDQSVDISAADWMTDDYTAKKSESEGVQLTFAHRLAKVTVNITEWNSEFDGAEKVIFTPKIYSNGSEIKITYATSADGADAYTVDGGSTAIDPYISDDTYTAIVAPAKYAADDKFMTFTAGGQEMTVLANTAELTDGLQPGKHYTFNLTVGKDAVSIASVTVAGWTDREINGVESDEVEVTTVLSGNTATIIIPDLATDAMVQEALKNLNTEGITTVNVDGYLNAERQTYIADALKDKTVTLYLAQLTEGELITELASDEDNITVICGYYIADDSTFVVYSADGLLAWNAYAQANPAANLSLKRDVTLTLAEGAASNWTSVGTEGTPYIGTVNGNGYSVTGMTINQTTQDAGFIGYLGEGGAVRNLTLKDVSVTSTADNVGAFVGRADHNTVIENCVVESGTISSAGGKYIGGVVGCTIGTNYLYRYDTFIIACSNKADVSGRLFCGGILGGCLVDGGDRTKIVACYNSGYISSDDGRFNAGITGDINTGSSSIRCCYNTGETNGRTGISGRNHSGYQSGHNYWSSRHIWASGTSTSTGTEYNNDAATKITSASEWETAMATMNTWLAENGYEYRYVLNTDAATKDAQPLVIVKAES